MLFTPTLAPMPRGILATCTAIAEPGTGIDAVEEALHAAYDAEPFVHVLPRGGWPRTGSVLGSNSVHLAAAHDGRTGRVTVVAAIDNLIKGAAGQAVQNANLALGLPETTGLPVIGVLGNDGVWANIKTIHKAFFPERVVAADLGRRPYHAVVTALGGYGELVTDPAHIGAALQRAEASGLPALVDVHIAETVRASSNYAQ